MFTGGRLLSIPSPPEGGRMRHFQELSPTTTSTPPRRTSHATAPLPCPRPHPLPQPVPSRHSGPSVGAASECATLWLWEAGRFSPPSLPLPGPGSAVWGPAAGWVSRTRRCNLGVLFEGMQPESVGVILEAGRAFHDCLPPGRLRAAFAYIHLWNKLSTQSRIIFSHLPPPHLAPTISYDDKKPVP